MVKLPVELSRIPIVTRTTVIASTALSVCFWILNYRTARTPTNPYNPPPPSPSRFLALVPRSSCYLVWTFVTSSFINSNIFTLGISLTSLLLGGRYIERSFSSRELFKFYAVVTLVPNLILFSILVLLYIPTRSATLLDLSLSGTLALQSAILVAFKQLVPEHSVTLYKNALQVRVRHFPLLFLLITTACAPILHHYSGVASALLGFLVSWTYLRFYKYTPPDLGAPPAALHGVTSTTWSCRGDASETFSMAQFFPDALQPPVERVSDAVYETLVAVGVCSPLGVHDGSAMQNGAVRSAVGAGGRYDRVGPGGGSSRAEAERRRTAALRALDQKLSSSSSKHSTSEANATAREEAAAEQEVQSVQPGSVSLPPQVDH